METVLYDLHYKFPALLIGGIFSVTIFCLFVVWWLYRKDCKEGNEYTRMFGRGKMITLKQEKRCMVGFAIVMFLIMGMFIFADWKVYDSVKKKYEAGNYGEVIGYVENFVDRGQGGRDYFEINGIEFDINPSNLFPGEGYARARDNGGVITGNGQHLHIKYINRYVGNIVERYIVYIAEIEGSVEQNKYE